MSNVDTLKMFDEYKDAGYTESEARAAIKNLDRALDGLATKEFLNNEFKFFMEKIDSKFEKIESKFTLLWILGAAIFVVVCSPIIQKILGV